MKLKIAQISDIHIGSEPIKYHGIDVRENFIKVLNHVQLSSVDLIVFSGDLALDMGEEEAYVWILNQMKRVAIPYLVMSGNHDSVERISRIFGVQHLLKNDMLYFKKEFKGFELYFLDTEPDYLDIKQMEWLRQEHVNMNENTLVFMHHPPCNANHLFMDRKYPLHNYEHVQNVFLGMPKIRHVFCGHYHFEKTIKLGSFNVHICPATQMQISPTNKDFEVLDFRPGWRLIEWDGQSLNTTVYYCD